MSWVAVARIKPEKVERLKTWLYELTSRHQEIRETFLHASYRNTGIDYKVIPDKIGGWG